MKVLSNTDLSQIPHLPDVLNLILCCAGGDDHLRAPLAQLIDYI